MDDNLQNVWRIPECGLDGKWFVDVSAVRIDDLVRNNRPGAIIPCRHLPAVQYVPAQLEDFSRVAGMISDAA